MTRYDLTSVDLPRLQGAALRAFAQLVETPAVGAAILTKLLKDGGFDALARAELAEAPRPNPLVPARIPDPEREDPAPDLSAIRPSEDHPLVSIAALRAAYARGSTDPVEVAERALAEAERRRPASTIFVASHREEVQAQAEASRARWARGAPEGPLDGIPVAVKDEVDMIGYPTTVGTAFLGRAPALRDATTVARLRAAGAVLLGKANLHEIGINPNGANPHYGLVENPHGEGRDPGGSSSGSAAAVAAGLCPLALGADGGGSIRIPAALCGVVGLKATYGRISEHGAAPLCWSVGHLGPIGATVADVALGYALMGGPDPKDPPSLVQPELTLEGYEASDLTGLKLGVYTPWFEHAQAPVVKACRDALERLEAAGAKVVEVEIPDLDLIRVAHAVTILGEMATSMSAHAAELGKLAPHVRVNVTLGRRFGAVDYVRAQRVRARALAHVRRVFDAVDVLVTPSTAATAPRIPVSDPKETWSDLSTVTELMRYAFLGNFTGNPGLTVPVGVDPEGLPIGLQLMGDHWQEALLLRVGRALERSSTPPRAAGYLELCDPRSGLS